MGIGHVMRREEGEPTRLALDFEVEGNRPKGRPKQRWETVVARDMGTGTGGYSRPEEMAVQIPNG